MIRSVLNVRSAESVVSVVSASVSAQDLAGTLKKIKETGTITIGHRESSIPFSYLDDKQQPIGYAMDLCMKVVDAVKAELAPYCAPGAIELVDALPRTALGKVRRAAL